MAETFAERYGITREELRERILARRAEEREREQRELDAKLLELGREHQETARERREQRPKLTIARPPRPEPLPRLSKSDDCDAYGCGNRGTVDLVIELHGRPLRARYCVPHAEERSLDLVAAGGHGRRT